MQIISGIYKIVNKTNGKVYIGSSTDIFRRWEEHKTKLRNNIHYNTHLQRSWNKYLESSFEFIIEEICDRSVLFDREEWHIQHNSQHTYNMLDFAGGGNINGGKIAIKKDNVVKLVYSKDIDNHLSNGWILGGRNLSQTTKIKIGNSNRGKPKPPLTLEHRKKLSQAAKQRIYAPLSEEAKYKLRQNRIGKFHSEETKKKMSLDRQGAKHPFYGKHHSNETKEKLSSIFKEKFTGSGNPNFDSIIYNFKHSKTGEIHSSNRYDFYTKYNLDPSNVNKLIRGRIKKLSGWIINN